ncbi:MAG: ACP S-malonyltransferase [SAR324 cluster bacterium]|nr:ACP S-malonyltransferase [SAR324 cluster bacterium]
MVINNNKKNYAFIFPGQGSQKIGMLNDYLADDLTKELIDEANEALGYDLLNLCQHGPIEKLTLTENAQPAILAVSYIAYRLFSKLYSDIKPSYLAGHSLGEYTAFLAGGSFSFGDALRIVKLRGKYMQESVPNGVGAMGALLGVDKDKALTLCQQAAEGEVLLPANYNCPGQIVVSGHKGALMRLKKIAKLIILPVSVPFHSPLIDDVEDKMRKVLDNYEIKDSKIGVINNIKNQLIFKREDVKKSLLKQIVAPVLWQSGIEHMINNGVVDFIEFGHSKVLVNMLKKTNSAVRGTTFCGLNIKYDF